MTEEERVEIVERIREAHSQPWSLVTTGYVTFLLQEIDRLRIERDSSKEDDPTSLEGP